MNEQSIYKKACGLWVPPPRWLQLKRLTRFSFWNRTVIKGRLWTMSPAGDVNTRKIKQKNKRSRKTKFRFQLYRKDKDLLWWPGAQPNHCGPIKDGQVSKMKLFKWNRKQTKNGCTVSRLPFDQKTLLVNDVAHSHDTRLYKFYWVCLYLNTT